MSKELIDIEKLVRWALVDQKVELAEQALQALEANGLATNQRRTQEMIELGTPVQQGYADQLLVRETHEDAFTLFAAINGLDKTARQLVVVHAKLDTRPDWYPEGAGLLVNVKGKFGRPVMIEDAYGNKQPVKTWSGVAPTIVNQARAEYVVWWEALSALALNLENNLVRFKPCPPRAERNPWHWADKKVG